ncbi:MAG: ribonuclease P protein component [Acidimicrobiales bacterium]
MRRAETRRSGPLTVSWLPAGPRARPVLVFAISKSVGNAVARNRLRRRLREAARRELSLRAGMYLIRTKPPAASLGFRELRDHLDRAVRSLPAAPK